MPFEQLSRKDIVLHCGWLLRPGESPQQNVRITVDGGLVAEIVPCPADERPRIRPVAVMPQFVNAHTHLEFSNLTSPIQPASPFTDWIRAVISSRLGHTNDQDFVPAAVQSGLREVSSAGTGLFGEITTSAAGLTALLSASAAADCQAVSFCELIGFTAERIDDEIHLAEQHRASLTSSDTSNVTPGFSPHAPYSVHPDLVAAVTAIAEKQDIPVAIHLAETLDEIELLGSRTGRFVDFLKSMNLWDASVLASVSAPLDYLRQLATVPHALAIHCNYLSSAEITFLGGHPNIAVVYCPRTHAYFRHAPHPWRSLLAAGATVTLGTDSRASNPDLSIWKELQHIARQPESPPIWELLPMITTDAARALGQSVDQFTLKHGTPFRAVTIPCHCDSVSKLNQTLQTATAVETL